MAKILSPSIVDRFVGVSEDFLKKNGCVSKSTGGVVRPSGGTDLKKKVKKKKDIHALSMKPPMGLRPDDVTPELGTKFVKEFVPIAWEATKEKFKKKTMKNLRILFQESKDSGAFKVVAVNTVSV